MQFMLLAFDGADEGAPARRLSVREQHIALGDKLVAEGKMLYGTAILVENGNMIGSCRTWRRKASKDSLRTSLVLGLSTHQTRSATCETLPGCLG